MRKVPLNCLKRQSFITLLYLLPAMTHIAIADPIHVQRQSEKAAPETIEFGRLVGNWKIRDYSLASDGSWQEGNGADWNFYWILGGAAIQDDWIAPGMDKPAPEQGRQFGTNVRIYNPKEKQWEMAWASNTGSKVDTFTAASENGDVVMKGFYNGANTQVTFYNISDKHFSWKMEREDQNTGKWNEVYRIEADRVPK